MRQLALAALLLSAACAKQGPYAVLETSKGRIVAKLYEDRAPKTVAHLRALAGRPKPFYNGLIFHRVAPGFLIGSVLVAGLSTVLFGWSWMGAVSPIADSVTSGEINSLAIWPRLSHWLPAAFVKFGPIVAFAIVYLLLLGQAWRGRARRGLAMGLFLLASPYLFTWYVVTPAALSAVEDDIPALWLAFALSAYTGLLYLGRVGSVFDVF